MWTNLLMLCGALVLSCRDVTARSDGAPSAVCADGNQLPQHGTYGQTVASPYTLTADVTVYTPGQMVTVTLSGGDFKGFFITAKDAWNQNVGSFVLNGASDQQLLCTNGVGVTHVSAQMKSQVTVTWNAPSPSFGDDVTFRASVVQEFLTFWNDVTSMPLMDASSATPEPEPEPEPTTTPMPSSFISFDLSMCGVTKGCFRSPSNCDIDDCDAVVTWTPSVYESYVEFEMQTTHNWMALGFSEDSDMGDDYVLVCRPRDNSASMVSAFNNGRSNTFFADPSFGLSEREGSSEDGVIKCTGRREISASGNSDFVDLDEQYTLFLATGDSSTEVFIFKHDEIPLISASQVNVVQDVRDMDRYRPDPDTSGANAHTASLATVALLAVGLMAAAGARTQ